MAFTKINAAGIGSTETVTLHSLEVLNNATVGGVLTYEDVTNVDSVGLITARNGIVVGSGITLSQDGDIFTTGITTFTNDVKINVDSKKIILGAGADLELFHNGTNSHMRTQTGNLIIDNNSGGTVNIRPKIGEEGVVCTTDGSTALYHDGTKKFETSSSGVSVTGSATVSGDVTANGGDMTISGSSAILHLVDTNDNPNYRVQNIGGTFQIYDATTDTARLSIASGGAATISGDLTIPDKIIHSGDTNTAIRFPSADTVSIETAGSERLRVDSSGNLQVVRNVSIDNNGELAVFEDDTSLVYTNSAKLSLDFASNVARIRSSGNGSFTSRPLAFFITNDEKVRITSTGVGIGGITPSNALDVQGGTTNTAIVARSTDSTAQISFVDNSTTGVGSVAVGAEGDNFIIRSGSGGTERVRINSDGNVMITGKNASVDYSQTSQLVPLYLKTSTNLTAVDTAEGASSDGLFRLEDGSSSNDRYHGIELRSKRGGDIRILNQDRMSNSGDLVIAQYSDDAGQGLKEKIRLSGVYDAVQIAGKGGASINADLGDQVQKTDVYISTKSEMTNATMNAGTELAGIIRFHETGDNNDRFHGIELRNKNSGDVRILNQATSATNFASMVFVTDNGSTAQRMIINGNGNIGAPSGNNIYNASDERLKENIVELTDGLNKINQIKPVSFTWKEGWDPDLDGLTQYGFGAHQVKSVDEILVESFGERDINLNGETIDNPLRVNEKHVIPLLVKAVQELSAKVAALEG